MSRIMVRLARVAVACAFCACVGLLPARSAFGWNTVQNEYQNAGPIPFGDDYGGFTAQANPYLPIAVSTVASNPPGQCAWINTGLTQFQANQTTGQTWTFNWAGAATEAKVEAGINIIDYRPYVVNRPPVTLGNGVVRGSTGPGEFAGAVCNLSYTPTAQNGAPLLVNQPNTTMWWIQGLMGTENGNTIPTGLDNFSSFAPGWTRNYSSPFYNGGTMPGVGGTYVDPNTGNTDAYFLDRPLIPEGETNEMNQFASIQFQVVLATDTTSVVAGVTNNAVTLYGGVWWGFNAQAVDVPEPASLTLLALAFVGAATRRRAA